MVIVPVMLQPLPCTLEATRTCHHTVHRFSTCTISNWPHIFHHRIMRLVRLRSCPKPVP